MNPPVTIATTCGLLEHTPCTVTMYMYTCIYIYIQYIIVYIFRVIINIIGVTHYILNINVLQNACHMYCMVVVYTHDAVFISPDDTLTEANVMDALTGVRLWDRRGYRSYLYLHIPLSTYDKIVSRHPGEKRHRGEEEAIIRSLVSEFLSHHPLPSWTHIVTLIRALEMEWDSDYQYRKARKGTADMVSDKYLKSELYIYAN